MSSSYHTGEALILLPLLLLAPAVLSLFLFVRYTCLRRNAALLAWTVMLIGAPAMAALRLHALGAPRLVPRDQAMVAAVAVGLFYLAAAPFVLRLYSKWRDRRLTEAEQLPGAAGFRAWFSPANLIMAVVISLLAWRGYDVSLPLMLLLTCGALAFWPALTPGPAATVIAEPPLENLSGEREKVLSLLEAGKITAEESAELLNALGATARPLPPQLTRSSGAARLALVGAGIVFVGFLLPWFAFSPAAELSRAMSSVMPRGFPQLEQMIPSQHKVQVSHKVQITGGSVANGLGWVVLACAAAAALIPHLTLAWDRSTLRTVQLVALGVGSAILLYLVTQSFRHVAIGLVIAFAGYLVEWAGLLREGRRVTASAFSEPQEVPQQVA